jgi:cephalosporin-C deacetylase-like acetyl esterase
VKITYNQSRRPASFTLFASLVVVPLLTCAARGEDELAGQLRKLDARVYPADSEQGKELPRLLSADVRARRDAANRRETELWSKVATRADWERFRDVRIKALQDSLGRFPEPPRDLKVQVTGKIDGDGYRVENLVFESRPGLLVTANLYSPAEPSKPMPGILICHSHHNPKTQGELQDMGKTWARQGCLVLVPDQLGHGERRQHPFVDATSYPQPFRVDRQDYHFRYNTGIQLHLLGDSLIGWMVWDLRRCVDLLLSRPGIDKERILLLGAVAGGGDPAAVTAALDHRIAAVAPFNFGGPQPETTYPLPPGAEEKFNYAGSGSWESTRNLRLSACDGFTPWVIVGAVAPRRLIYAHEFAWDQEHDPVWARLQKIYGFDDVPDNLAETHGKGAVTGKAGPNNTHANNIGPVHRKQIYPALKRWFDMPVPEKEYQQRHAAADLACLTPEALKTLKPRPLWDLAEESGAERSAAARRRLTALKPEDRLPQLRRDWAKLLGPVEPEKPRDAAVEGSGKLGTATVERVGLKVEAGMVVPLLLLLPPHRDNARLPVVVGVGQDGKEGYLRQRPEVIAALLGGGIAVCLPDVRGTGETRLSGDARGRQSPSTGLSSSELMLGGTMVGARLRDLRSVLRYLRTRTELDGGRVGLWGASFAPVNADDRNTAVPLDAEKLPDQSEPLGGLLALFGALYEDEVRAVLVEGGLVSYQSVLHGQNCNLPHDVVVPGALTAGDLPEVAALLAPRLVRLVGLVDGTNRRVPAEALARTYAPAREAYTAARAGERLQLVERSEGKDATARWLLEALRAAP